MPYEYGKQCVVIGAAFALMINSAKVGNSVGVVGDFCGTRFEFCDQPGQLEELIPALATSTSTAAFSLPDEIYLGGSGPTGPTADVVLPGRQIVIKRQ